MPVPFIDRREALAILRVGKPMHLLYREPPHLLDISLIDHMRRSFQVVAGDSKTLFTKMAKPFTTSFGGSTLRCSNARSNLRYRLSHLVPSDGSRSRK